MRSLSHHLVRSFSLLFHPFNLHIIVFLSRIFSEKSAQIPALDFHQKTSPSVSLRCVPTNPAHGGFFRSGSNSLCRWNECGIVQNSCINLWSLVFICLWNAVTAMTVAIRPRTSLSKGTVELKDPTQSGQRVWSEIKVKGKAVSAGLWWDVGAYPNLCWSSSPHPYCLQPLPLAMGQMRIRWHCLKTKWQRSHSHSCQHPEVLG